MSLNTKVKKFFLNVFKGNKKLEIVRENVRWEEILEENKRKTFDEQDSFEGVSPCTEELTERSRFITNVAVIGDNVRITRASVYVQGDDESCSKSEESHSEEVYELLDMDTAAVTFSDLESSFDGNQSESFSKLVDEEMEKKVISNFFNSGPDFTTEATTSKLNFGSNLNFKINPDENAYYSSSFTKNMETESQNFQTANKGIISWNPAKKFQLEPTFDSCNSLNIERELNELMGTLCTGIDAKDTPNVSPNFEDISFYEDGSRINVAFVSSEAEDQENFKGSIPSQISLSDPYWKNQRAKSKSFGDKYKLKRLMQRGRERLSMIEIRNRPRAFRRTVSEDAEVSSQVQDESALIFETHQPHFLRLAYDRSSVMEPKVTSIISLPQRPQSALDNRQGVGYSSGSSRISKFSEDCGSVELSPSQRLTPPASLNVSEGFDDCIDWNWLEDAIKGISPESLEQPYKSIPSLRVDAGCQTHSTGQSWQGEEERMRSETPSPRVSSTAAIGVTSECRAFESGGCHEDMPCKPFVEGSGTGDVSSWLRQSMRRVRHFNLEDPVRIRSAPPESLVHRLESDVETVGNDRLTTSSSVTQRNQRPQSEEGRSQRRRTPRTRPSSAPDRRSLRESNFSQQQAEAETSSIPSVLSEPQDNLGYESDSTDRHPSPRSVRHRNRDEEGEEAEGRSPLGPWPHGLSSILAGLGCTLGLFNISRFAVLSVHFGSNFIIQFLILSIVLGVPLLAFHAALGQTLGAGPVDMWKISPLFQGIGIALLLAQALIGMYSIVGVSWMFVYFRDSFITKQDAFRWAEPFRHYREDNIFATSILNTSGRLEETVPDYLNGVVLQRHGLTSPENAFGHLKFQLTFNLAVVWMIVFVSLSKGLRSYGKVVYVFSVVPVLGILVLCSKLLGMTPLQRGFFPQTEWSEFFLNAKSWISAATEVMLTWNLFGAATMQVTSHNRSSKKLWRDIATIILLTVLVLILAAFLGNMCHQLITLRGYTYVPSSFERISTFSFLRPSAAPLPPSYMIPVRHMPHASLVAGERIGKPGAIHESGYQVIRLATELVPATLAILDGNYLSPFWAVLFYFTLILFGIAQQLAIWHCVITGIMAINASSLKSWETTITFFTCAAGFILGLPMTTELGIFVVYFLDYCLGGGWWIILLTLFEICAVLMVRGRPYSGENISVALFGKNNSCISLWAIPLLTFAWNVIMPVALLVMSITIFKSGGYRDLWLWKCGNADYWPLWTREVGVFVQIIPLLCIPIVAIVQCYRYLSKGPADIFDRLANLYRPAAGIRGITDEENTAITLNVPQTESGNNGITELPATEDPPPKYTPPPSYSTATGNRIAKLLRQSFRRSVRRIQTALGPDLVHPPRPPPPDYASVLVEMNQHRCEERESNRADTNYTAADVAQVLRCSFRRTNNTNLQSSQNRATNTISPNLVMNPHWNS